jgi:hypothetical protein
LRVSLGRKIGAGRGSLLVGDASYREVVTLRIAIQKVWNS